MHLARHLLAWGEAGVAKEAHHILSLDSAGWQGNQVLGGLLLHTIRRLHAPACSSRFSKFVTLCAQQRTIYDSATGLAVSLNATTGGLLPYGIDPIFLPRSPCYDSRLNICELLPTPLCLPPPPPPP